MLCSGAHRLGRAAAGGCWRHSLTLNPKTAAAAGRSPLLPQVNYNLLAVNCFMAVTGIYQLQRKIRHDLEQSGKEQPTATPAAAAAVA